MFKDEVIKESEEKYRSIVENSPDAIIVHSRGNIIFANEMAINLLKASSFNDIRDKSLYAFVHGDYREKVKEQVRFILETGSTPGHFEAKFLDVSGRVFDVEIIGTPFEYMGEPAEQIIIRDISEWKRMEEKLIREKEKAEENDNLKTAFLHNISHEIRTPMNAIVGFSALLNEPGITQEIQKSYIKIIVESSDQLLAIVNDIIEISNIQVGILKKSINEINLNQLLMSVYEQFSQRAKEKGLGFTLHTALKDERSMIETDSVKLNQILSNLLGNAFKFTKRGRISFGYSIGDQSLEFFVADTGIGIHENQLDKIFERFYQVESSASRAYEGTGLGLTISRAYTEFLGGRIWVTSRPDEGSIFNFTIPYSAPKYISEMETNVKGRGIDEKNKSVLIAEDDDNNFFLMKELLSDLNLNIIRASNGIEAVNAFKTNGKIDLVLMDIKMPLMDGYEATRKIREQDHDVTILAQTAYADDELKAIESGCSGFISKPFIKDRFLSLVKGYL